MKKFYMVASSNSEKELWIGAIGKFIFVLMFINVKLDDSTVDSFFLIFKASANALEQNIYIANLLLTFP